ncbi:thiol-disulfide isomerase/thioredoxin [Haloactinospora alba]|uniref:Thiol-disulfide isomerase/thioredoxin n=1 Tax=Haloactinospora alba TaxID=405555 RepID=A0A543NMR9_9ACTN|nr:TlpA disulfide reductase family protein [Haloactinospora alba]TQN33121.1 thiol-disulfide isomerase/thioredoxin [Haloactinospora alba]
MPHSTPAVHRRGTARAGDRTRSARTDGRTPPSRLRRRVVAAAAAALAGTLVLAGCSGSEDSPATDSGNDDGNTRYIEGDGSTTSFAPDEREPAPDVEGETLDGETVSLDDYEGTVLVLNMWASWCGPCRAESDALNEVYTDHKGDGVDFLGVNIKDDRTAAESFEENQGIDYPSLYDQPGRIPQAFRDTVPPKAIPSTLVLDRQGRIAARVIGPVKYNKLSDLVTSVKNDDDNADAGAQ